MITIAIPIYNRHVVDLITELHRQCVAATIPFEILAVEDGSTMHVESNAAIAKLDGVKHIINPENHGRSHTRNELIKQARYNHIVLMDCDARVHNSNYINTWIKHCTDAINVIIGGTDYDPNEHNPQYSLRLKYGRIRESAMHEHKAFTAFNFMIHKAVAHTVTFNEEIKGYGQEDFLYGHELVSANIPILFIENRLIHDGLDPNTLFIKKTEEGVRNLYLLYSTGKFPFMVNESKLLYTFSRIKKYRVDGLTRTIFSWFRTPLIKNLTSTTPSLFLFDMYKLGYMCYITKND